MIPSEQVLKVDGLSKLFRSKLAVSELTFSLSTGSIVGLLGGNGAGKTTTLSMLLGLLKPTSGEIRLFGHDFIKLVRKSYHKSNLLSLNMRLYKEVIIR